MDRLALAIPERRPKPKRFTPFWLITALLIAAGGAPHAQTPNQPTFETAVVRRSDAGARGVAVTRQPTRVEYINWDLGHLLQEAFDVRDYQIEGPGWLQSGNLRTAAGKYVVRATFAPGTSRPQFREMLQGLLQERLELRYHIEKRVRRVYELRVDPAGLKLKIDPNGRGGILTATRGHLDGVQVTMSEVAAALSRHLDFPVVDATQLEGSADIRVDWAPNDLPLDVRDNAAVTDSIFVALRKQSGLRLEASRVPIDVIVIDHVNPDPLEN
jgi:uncharacterized protein (TIGR03435 family)